MTDENLKKHLFKGEKEWFGHDSQTDSGFISESNLLSSEFDSNSNLEILDDQENSFEHKELYYVNQTLEINKLEENVIQNTLPIFQTQDVNGDTQLHLSVLGKFVDKINYLINFAPDLHFINKKNYDQQTALHIAVITRQPKVVRKLILAGSNLSIRNSQGNTAIHLAVIIGDMECAKALLDPLLNDEKYSLNEKSQLAMPQVLGQKNFNGATCIHIAVQEGHLNIIRELIKYGADVDAREGLRGYTPLQLAIDYKRYEIIDFLLKEGNVNLETKNYAGWTACKMATKFNDKIISDFFQGKSKNESSDEYYSSSDDSEEDSDDEFVNHMKHSQTPVLINEI